MIEIIKDTLIDSIKLLPFLFITYILMEYIEHKTSHKVKSAVKKSEEERSCPSCRINPAGSV